MKLRRMRQDFDHLTSWVLLLVAAATIVTGFVVHLWDLHGFTWHTYFGYAMTVAVLVHVCLNFRQLTAYAGFRLKQGWRATTGAPRPPRQRPRPTPEPRTAAATARAVLLSRRGLVGLALGGAGGYLIGQSLRATPQLEAGSDLGLVYHRWSSDPGVVDAVGALTSLGRQPPLYKSYGDAVPAALSRPSFAGGLSTEQAISRRQSIRAYARGADDRAGTLPRARADRRAQPGTAGAATRRPGRCIRSRPTRWFTTWQGCPAGRLPLRSWNTMRCTRSGPATSATYVVEHGLGQQFLGECAAVIYLTMIFQRMRFKYGERSYRYGLVEAGHLGQNLYLAATSLGLGVCAVGAYNDPRHQRPADDRRSPGGVGLPAEPGPGLTERVALSHPGRHRAT